ncbi:Alpha/Beta hydrolase protein [Gigaspora margarita]|uniref:Alpha/Beta hydrolase protein n=1 Tax=Gigaspora margarita TaxID=4874 RepID=A0A8H4AKJ1_GIGMA|nr:Alpha/Beta hydrolase protein [Gigaspora margarita]
MSTITLRYLVQGLQRETPNIKDSLLVLHADYDVGMLKESICKNHGLVCKNKNIILWKIDIPKNDKRIKQLETSLVKKVFDQKCEKLSNREFIRDIFKSCPKTNHIHIIVSIASIVEQVFNHECEKLLDITKPINSIFKFPLKEKNIHIIVSFENLMWMKINGVEVYTKTWKPKNEPKAYITFLHSYVDHIEKQDRKGSSLFNGTWCGVLNCLIFQGGALALYAIMDTKIKDFSGCIALSPLFKLEQGINAPEILIRVGKIVNRLFSNFTIKLELDSERFTSNGSFSQIYDDYTYINKYFMLTEVMDIIKYGNTLLKNKFNNKPPPILIIYGTKDKISDIKATKKFYNNLKGNSKVNECCSSRNQHSHCLHYEDKKDEVIDYCMQWILAGGKHSKSSENREAII